jgi:hypothetical protein
MHPQGDQPPSQSQGEPLGVLELRL